MPITRTTASVAPLLKGERAAFVAWATSRPSYVACTRRSAPEGAYVEAIGGHLKLRGRYQTEQDLVDRWRSLGRPEGIRNGRAVRQQRSVLYQGNLSGAGAARGAARRNGSP